MTKHLFIFNIVGLSPDYLNYMKKLPAFSSLIKNGQAAKVDPVFPALTLPAQASITTGVAPNQHGIVANGFYYPERLEISFWDQYRSLLLAEPFWERIKKKNPALKTALLFWQSTLYSKADFIITPKPIHNDAELIQWCYSKPAGLYEELSKKLGPFNLMHYWGPAASPKSSRWIMDAAISLLRKEKPNLMLVYLPHLDYSCQKYGPHDQQVFKDLEIADELLGNFLTELRQSNIDSESAVAVISEYSMTPVSKAIQPNKILKQADFFKVRIIEGRQYPDIELSRAFAMVDHQIAHIYIKNKNDLEPVFDLLTATPGIQAVLDNNAQKKYNIRHQRTGDLIALSDTDKWFAYYWWSDPDNAPCFAPKVEIHQKPGYDPLELFINPATMSVPFDTSMIKGSHGLTPQFGGEKALFIISGAKIDKPALADEIKMIDLAPLFENLLGSDV